VRVWNLSSGNLASLPALPLGWCLYSRDFWDKFELWWFHDSLSHQQGLLLRKLSSAFLKPRAYSADPVPYWDTAELWKADSAKLPPCHFSSSPQWESGDLSLDWKTEQGHFCYPVSHFCPQPHPPTSRPIRVSANIPSSWAPLRDSHQPLALPARGWGWSLPFQLWRLLPSRLLTMPHHQFFQICYLSPGFFHSTYEDELLNPMVSGSPWILQHLFLKQGGCGGQWLR
jgi:hypothetical protein